MDSSTVETWSDAGVDRKALRQTVERFRRVNDARLERYRGSRNERQRQLLDLLPLLFHLDHPLLPAPAAGQPRSVWPAISRGARCCMPRSS
jgi:hypothetical protein